MYTISSDKMEYCKRYRQNGKGCHSQMKWASCHFSHLAMDQHRFNGKKDTQKDLLTIALYRMQ